MSTYKTKDFYLACFIMSSGYEFINSTQEDRTVWFEFKSDDTLQNLVNDFINYNAMTNVRQFTKSMARLRKELDSHRDKI